MICPNCEKEITNEEANYCGLCSYWLKEPPYKTYIEKLHEEGKHDITKLIIPILKGERYDMFEQLRKEKPMQYKRIRENKDYFEMGFLFGFMEGLIYEMKEEKEKKEKDKQTQPPKSEFSKLSKSGKSGFEIVKLYNYPDKNHAIIRLKKGIIENLGLPYNLRHNKPLLAEVRNGVLLLKVIEELIHDEFE